ncbi:hypothetical protein GCM10009803_10440 [Microbacterium ginsengiterrae]
MFELGDESIVGFLREERDLSVCGHSVLLLEMPFRAVVLVALAGGGDMPRRPGGLPGRRLRGFYATQQVFTKPVVASATVGTVTVSC